VPKHTPLPLNATLRSVVATLDEPSSFVSRAYAVINRHEREHGPVVLRIGVSRVSRGRRPNYRIDDARTELPIAYIDGNTHLPWPEGTSSPAGDWSTGAMTHAEVRDLLNELRQNERLKR